MKSPEILPGPTNSLARTLSDNPNFTCTDPDVFFNANGLEVLRQVIQEYENATVGTTSTFGAAPRPTTQKTWKRKDLPTQLSREYFHLNQQLVQKSQEYYESRGILANIAPNTCTSGSDDFAYANIGNFDKRTEFSKQGFNPQIKAIYTQTQGKCGLLLEACRYPSDAVGFVQAASDLNFDGPILVSFEATKNGVANIEGMDNPFELRLDAIQEKMRRIHHNSRVGVNCMGISDINDLIQEEGIPDVIYPNRQDPRRSGLPNARIHSEISRSEKRDTLKKSVLRCIEGIEGRSADRIRSIVSRDTSLGNLKEELRTALHVLSTTPKDELERFYNNTMGNCAYIGICCGGTGEEVNTLADLRKVRTLSRAGNA